MRKAPAKLQFRARVAPRCRVWLCSPLTCAARGGEPRGRTSVWGPSSALGGRWALWPWIRGGRAMPRDRGCECHRWPHLQGHGHPENPLCFCLLGAVVPGHPVAGGPSGFCFSLL